MLSPFLFNVYLDEALKSSKKLKEVRDRGDLLAFADDMLILTNSKPEMGEIIRCLEQLEPQWNLRMNKAKSQILTKCQDPDIEGVPCMRQVKYLGVPVHVELQEQRKLAKESINRNLNFLRWKLKHVDVNIKDTVTCALARSILIYIGTPLTAAKVWNQKHIEQLEAQLFRQVNNLPNVISNKALMHVACSLRPAWEIIKVLKDKASLQSKN